MKRNYLNFLLMVVILFFGCGQRSENNAQETKLGKTKLFIYYFHSTHRCPTCNSIEENTKATLDKYFSKELSSGVIVFKSLNVDEKANEQLAKKYDAFGSALFLTSTKEGKEQNQDLTNFAFKNSRNKPEYFIDELRKKIEKIIK